MFVLVAAAIVIAGTFILKSLTSGIIKIVGLMIVAFLGRRADLGATGFGWVEGQDVTVIVAAALFGWISGIVLSSFVFKSDGFGRHFFIPIIAVGLTYLAAIFIEL